MKDPLEISDEEVTQRAEIEDKPIVASQPAVTQASSLSPLVQAAMDNRLDVAKLNDMLAIQEKYEAMEAKKAYHKAVAEFKAHAPTIKKDRTVTYETDKGVTTYKHVGLGYALSEINPALAAHGLSLTWKTNQENGQVSVTAYLTHALGHSEHTTLMAAPDSSGGKNGIQSIASSTTYLKRHTGFALLGLEGIDDDDGKGYRSNIEYITEQQEADMLALLDEVGGDKRQFLKVLKVEEYGQLPAQKYAGAIKILEQRRKKNAN